MAAKLSLAMAQIAYAVLRSAVSLAEVGANFTRSLGHLARVILFRMANVAYASLVLSFRYLAAVAHAVVSVVKDSIRAVVINGWHSCRISVLPVVGSVAAATLLLSAAGRNRDYLAEGRFEDGGLLVIKAVLAAVSLAMVWSAWSGLSMGAAAQASARTVRGLALAGVPGVAVGGWLLGLPGTLANGPIRVGWFTSTATVGILAAILWNRFYGNDVANNEGTFSTSVGPKQMPPIINLRKG
jgi:hypothetical protein